MYSIVDQYTYIVNGYRIVIGLYLVISSMADRRPIKSSQSVSLSKGPDYRSRISDSSWIGRHDKEHNEHSWFSNCSEDYEETEKHAIRRLKKDVEKKKIAQ